MNVTIIPKNRVAICSACAAYAYLGTSSTITFCTACSGRRYCQALADSWIKVNSHGVAGSATCIIYSCLIYNSNGYYCFDGSANLMFWHTGKWEGWNEWWNTSSGPGPFINTVQSYCETEYPSNAALGGYYYIRN